MRGFAGLFAAVLLALTTAIACQPPAPATTPAATTPSKAAATTPAETKPAAVPKLELAADIKLGVAFFNDSFEPHALPGPQTIQNDQIFDGLTQRDVEGRLQPALAESWTTVAPTTWEFRLRPNTRFHNGQIVSADDVRFTMERLMDPESRAPALPRFTTYDRAEVVNPTTIRLHTKTPDPLLPARMILAKVIPERLYKETGASRFVLEPVGTGPYRMRELRAGSFIVYEAFLESWRGRAVMPQARLLKIPEEAALVAALRTGEIDMANDFPVDLDREVRSQATLEVFTNVRTATHTIDLNQLQFDELKDKRVRQAINHAVDKDAVNRAATGGISVIAEGQLVPRGVTGYNPALRRFEFDLNRARTLMREAGRESGFSGTLLTLPGTNNLIAQAVGGSLNAINIRVEVQPVETAVYLQRYLAGQKGMFFLSPFNFGTLMDAAEPFSNFLGSAAPAIRRMENPEFDRLFTASNTELDPARRERLLQDAAAVLREETPSIFLFQQGYLIGASKKVRGFQPRKDASIRFEVLTRER